MSFTFQLVATQEFQSPPGSTTIKSATAGKAFGFWNNKDNTFQFKLPPGTCKAEISFISFQQKYK